MSTVLLAGASLPRGAHLHVDGVLGHESLRHAGGIRAVALTPDGRAMIAVSDEGNPTGYVWDLATGEARAVLRLGTYGAYSVAVSPDGALAAIGGADRIVRVMRIDTGELVREIPARPIVKGLAFVQYTPLRPKGAPSELALIIGDDRVPRVMSIATGAELRVLKGHLSSVDVIAVSADGTYAATAGGDQKIKLQDIARAKVLATSVGYASKVRFLPDGSLLSFGFDHARIVEVPSGRELRTIDRALGNLVDVATTSTRGPIGLFVHHDPYTRAATMSVAPLGTEPDTEIGIARALFRRELVGAVPLALTPDGERIILSLSDTSLSQGGALCVWSASDGTQLLPRGDGHLGCVTDLVAANGVVASASHDRTLKLWDVRDGRELETIAGGEDVLTALALCPDGRTALTASSYSSRTERSLQLWDVPGTRVRETLVRAGVGYARAVAISPDGRSGVATWVGRGEIFDLLTGERRAVLEKHGAQIDAVVFARDGRHVITGAADHLVKVWRTEDGAQVHALEGHTGFVYALATAPDGTVLSAGSGEVIRWDVTRGVRLATLRPRGDEISAIAISPSGARAAFVVGYGQPLELWSLEHDTLLEKLDLAVVRDRAQCVCFVDDETLLVGTSRGLILRAQVTG